MSVTLEQSRARTQAWGEDRGIYAQSTPLKQAFKAHEETLELVEALSDGDTDETRDAIGDTLVALTHTAKLAGLTLEECWQQAVETIEKRTGRMINGKFVKDA